MGDISERTLTSWTERAGRERQESDARAMIGHLLCARAATAMPQPLLRTRILNLMSTLRLAQPHRLHLKI